MRRISAEWKGAGRRIGFVPTMGYLHEGHLSLVRLARGHADRVVVSIFVNPLQFNERSDYDRYPVDLERDAALLQGEGVDAVFIPDAALIYPHDHQTRVTVTGLTAGLEGAKRPGHFEGVTTVVSILFNIVQPDLAVFGEKDFQQLRVIEQMVRDLSLPLSIVRGPLVREADGLALSSRNVRLSPDARAQAPCLFRALETIRKGVSEGERDVARLRERAARCIEASPTAALEYLEIIEETSLVPASDLHERKRYRAVVAAFVGGVRLIDTMPLSR